MTHRPPTMSYYHLPSKDTPASVSVMGWWCTILTPAFHWHTGLRLRPAIQRHTGPRHSKLYPQLTTCHPETHRPLTSIYTYIHSYTPSNNMLCIHYHMSWKDTPAFDINMRIHITDWCWMTHRHSHTTTTTLLHTWHTWPHAMQRHTGLRQPHMPSYYHLSSWDTPASDDLMCHLILPPVIQRHTFISLVLNKQTNNQYSPKWYSDH